jgi:exodeoxyribonuclease VII large subunit
LTPPTPCGLRYNPAMKLPATPPSENAFGVSGFQSAPVLSISALNRLARETLEAALPLMWVSGEISNLTRATSGHVYFTLKDANAQVRCAMWRNRAQLLGFRPENGMRVEARALVTLYEARGDYQLNVETLRPAGIGNLFEAFSRLKEKLSTEGLFDPGLKRALPRYPRALGVITSLQAAALRDVLVTLRRRAPQLRVVVYPSPVQGADAATQLVRALQTAGRRAHQDNIDAVLLVRGGGSLEDLWSFNDEGLARALRACPLPVVCGVGHETDVTIADFAADLRAPTPTGAAELMTADWFAARREVELLQPRLARALQRRLEVLAQRLDRAALRLVHPRERLQREHSTLKNLCARLNHASERHLERTQARIATLEARLQRQRPDMANASHQIEHLDLRLSSALRRHLAGAHVRLDTLATHLEHLAPQAVLERGYAIARNAQGHVLRSSTEVSTGDILSIQLGRGTLGAQVLPEAVPQSSG